MKNKKIAESIRNWHKNKNDVFIKKWLDGEIDGSQKKYNWQTSKTIRRYLHDKFDNKCSKCGWGEVNKYTKKVPLHIHHKDGVSSNNTPDNLELICPNCHALTENYGSRNEGTANTERLRSIYSRYYNKGS